MSEKKSLLQKLKELLNISRMSRPAADSESDRSDVTVEREPDSTAEDAVKGTDTADRTEATPDDGVDTATDASGETAADHEAETVAHDSGESATGDGAAVTDDETAAGSVELDDTVDEVDRTDDTADGATMTDEGAASSAPVDEISGIGPTYSERLGEADIETVTDLAAADAETVADATGVSESRASDWIDRANDFS